jgi:hypothetical protein
VDNLQKTNLVLTIALRAVALALLLLQALPAIFVLGLTFLMVASAAVIAVLSTVLR